MRVLVWCVGACMCVGMHAHLFVIVCVWLYVDICACAFACAIGFDRVLLLVFVGACGVCLR